MIIPKLDCVIYYFLWKVFAIVQILDIFILIFIIKSIQNIDGYKFVLT